MIPSKRSRSLEDRRRNNLASQSLKHHLSCSEVLYNIPKQIYKLINKMHINKIHLNKNLNILKISQSKAINYIISQKKIKGEISRMSYTYIYSQRCTQPLIGKLVGWVNVISIQTYRLRKCDNNIYLLISLIVKLTLTFNGKLTVRTRALPPKNIFTLLLKSWWQLQNFYL